MTTTPEQIAALVERLRDIAMEKQQEAWGRLDGGQDLSIGSMMAEEAADMLEQLAAERGKIAGVQVRPLEWLERGQVWEAKTPVGTYSVGFEDGWWAELEKAAMWEWDAPQDPRSYDGPHAAMMAAQADYEARILAVLEPAPDARTYEDGVTDAAKVVERCLWPDSYARYFADAIRALLMEKPHD